MSEPHYDKMSKKTLIDRLLKAERQLRTGGSEKGHGVSAVRRGAAKKTDSEGHPDSASVREEAKRASSACPAGTDVKFASESDYTILDKDGHIRRLYRVVKDIQDDAGNPVFSEGALYEISSKPCTASGTDHSAVPGESDQTELICRFRPNGTLTYVNEAYCRYFGCERDELQDRNILLSISESDREKVYTRLKDLRPERPVDTLEYRIVTVFGDILWNQWTYRALFDDSGNVLEYQSVGRDITFRKYTQDVLEKRASILEAVTFAAEAFLKSSSWRDRIEKVLERFGAAMNASHVFLCENGIGEKGDIAVLRSYEWLSPQIKGAGHRQKFLRNSKLAVRFSRWVYEKSEGRPISGTIGQFPDQDVEELALDKKMSIAVMPVLIGERWWGFIGFADYSGDIQWSEDEIAPLGAASEILGAAIEREEKERALAETHATIREQERFLAGVFDAIQDGIMVAAPDMTILRANKTLEKRFPHAPTLPGRKCYEAYYGLNSPCCGCAIQKTLKTGKSASMIRSIVGPDGEFKAWVEVFSYPWIDGNTGHLRGVIEYSRDITKRKNAEEAREQSEKLLRQYIDSSKDLIFLKDDGLRYLFANRACLDFSHVKEEDVVGKTDLEFFPDDQAREFRRGDLVALGKKTGQEVHDLVVNDRFLEVTKFPVDLGGGRNGVGGIIRDVTERKQAEESLRVSEVRYRELADTIPVGVYEANLEGNLSYVNKTAREMFGFGENEIAPPKGVNFLEIIAPEEQGMAIENSRRVRQEGALVCQEYTFARIDGRRFTGLVTSRPLIRDGRVMGSTGVCTDISALKEAQSALRKNEAMLQSIFQAAPIGIAFGEGRTLKWTNECFQRISGFDKGELEGDTARVLYDNDEEYLRVGEAFYKGIAQDGIGTTRTQWTCKDGSKIDVLLSMSPIFPEDATKGVVVTALDVTEQKKADEALRASETRYRELADNMPAGIYEATLDGRVIYANKAALEMFGYSADEVEKGVGFAKVIAPESKEALVRHIRMIRDGSAFNYEYVMLRRDGSRFYGLNMARPIIKDGRVVGSSGIVTDISELKQVQEALRKNEALLGSILRAAPIGVGMVHDRVLGWVNEGMTEMTGYAVDEIKGKSARVLYPDEEEFERAGREKYAEIAARGKGAVETRWKRKDGTIFDVHLSSAPIDPSNLAAGVVFTALDITAQKKAARILLFAKEDLELQVAEQTQELDVANMLLKIELEEHRKTEEALVQQRASLPGHR